MYKCCINFYLVLTFLIGVSKSSTCQERDESAEFDLQSASQLGVGFAITSFSSNFTYFVSPSYSYRYRRHLFGITPFYGRLDALPGQHDIGVGLDYRLYPFKNMSNTMLYFPTGIHYNYKWTISSQKQSVLYKVGFGIEAFLGKGFSLSLDANFGIGQTVSSKISSGETASLGSQSDLNYYFIPVFRVSYQLK